MKVHNLLFGGSVSGKYFSKVTVVSEEKEFFIEHDIYSEVFGQSSQLPTDSLNHYASEYLENFDNDELQEELKRLRLWKEVSQLDVYTFDVNGKELTIEID